MAQAGHFRDAVGLVWSGLCCLAIAVRACQLKTRRHGNNVSVSLAPTGGPSAGRHRLLLAGFRRFTPSCQSEVGLNWFGLG